MQNRFADSVIISRMKSAFFRRGVSAVCAGIFCASSAPAWGKSAKEVFAEVARSVVVVLALDSSGETSAQGSGVVVGKNEVATNCHVIEDAAKIVVRQAADSSGGENYRMSAEILARDNERDLCLLFVDELSEPPAAPIATMGAAKGLTVGEEIFAVGAPEGLELSMSRGIVSQLRGFYGKRAAPLVQTDAAISPGSSGGGLFNENGKLVGITTFKWKGESLNFAIPVEWVEELHKQAEQKIVAEIWKKCAIDPSYECVMYFALRVAHRIESAIIRVNAMRTIAAAHTESGHKQLANQILSLAIDAAHDVALPKDRAWLFRLIAVNQAENGDVQSAQKSLSFALGAAQKISNAYSRPRTLGAIAVAQAEIGDVAAALGVARNISIIMVRNDALLNIAVVRAKANDVSKVRQIITEARKNIAQSKGDGTYNEWEYKFIMLGEVAAALVKIGDDESAQKIYQSAQSIWEEKFPEEISNWSLHWSLDDEFWLAVVNNMIMRGEFSAAMKSVWNAGSPNVQSILWEDVVRAQAEAGFFLDAIKSARTRAGEKALKEGGQFVGWRSLQGLRVLAEMQARAGHIDDAFATVAKIDISDIDARTKSLRSISIAQAQVGNFNAAVDTIRRIENASDRAWAQRDIVSVQAEMGEFKDALRIMSDIEHFHVRAWALADIAKHLAARERN